MHLSHKKAPQPTSPRHPAIELSRLSLSYSHDQRPGHQRSTSKIVAFPRPLPPRPLPARQLPPRPLPPLPRPAAAGVPRSCDWVGIHVAFTARYTSTDIMHRRQHPAWTRSGSRLGCFGWFDVLSIYGTTRSACSRITMVTMSNNPGRVKQSCRNHHHELRASKPGHEVRPSASNCSAFGLRTPPRFSAVARAAISFHPSCLAAPAPNARPPPCGAQGLSDRALARIGRVVRAAVAAPLAALTAEHMLVGQSALVLQSAWQSWSVHAVVYAVAALEGRAVAGSACVVCASVVYVCRRDSRDSSHSSGTRGR